MMKTMRISNYGFHARIFSLLLCIVLVSQTFCVLNLDVNAQENIIYVSTAKDLAELSKNCKLDTWSQGKTVVLKNNIDLAGSDFVTIPTFGGTFDGKGYTISGFYYEEGTSHCGLFRYVQKSGVVRELNVTGLVEPGGSKSYVGGIVGENRGIISGCTFKGVVSGKTNVGAIAGSNETTGSITGCTSYGTVDGEHYVGGIAGQNSGSVVSCKSFSSVCTSAQDSKVSLDDLSLDIQKLNSTENLMSETDIGGICGFSSGILQSCENRGNVGYAHVGYNIGGVAGRQSGFISDCKNFGIVNGRKDIGGIVGQMEPYILLDFSKDSVQKIDDELEILRSKIDSTLNSANSYSNEVLSMLEKMRDTSGNLKNQAHDIADRTTSVADGTLETVNDVSARFVRAMDRTSGVLDTGKDATDTLNKACDSLKTSVSYLGNASDNMTAALKELSPALDELEKSGSYATKALNDASDAMYDIKTSLGDTEMVGQYINDLADSVSDAGTALGNAGDTVKNIADILSDMKASPEITQFRDSMVDGTRSLGDSLSAMSSAMETITDGVKQIRGEIDTDSIDNAAKQLQEAFKSLSDASVSASMALAEIYDAIEHIKNISPDNGAQLEKFASAIQSCASFVGDIGDTVQKVSEVLAELDTPPSEEQIALIHGYTVRLAKDFSGAGKSLSDAVKYAAYVVSSLDKDEARGASDDLVSAVSHLSASTSQFGSAFSELSLCVGSLRDSVGNRAKLENGVDDVIDGIKNVSEALGDCGNAVTDMSKACKKLVDSGYLDKSFDSINEQLDNIGSQLKGLDTAMNAMSDAFKGINDETDLASLKNGFGKMSESLSTLSDALFSINNSIAIINRTLPIVTSASDELTNALREGENAAEFASDSLSSLSKTIDGIKAIVDEFNAKGDIVFPTFGSDYTDAVDGLFDSMQTLSDQTKELTDKLGSIGNDMNSELHGITSAASQVVSVVTDAYNESLDTDVKDMFEDISDADNLSSSHGTVVNCVNYSKVTGDLNVGGCAGTMAIEYDFDPEDDVTNSGSNSLSFKYQTMAVLKKCVNIGTVTAKKNCAGGNVGMMSLGTVLLCEAYGDISSTSGDYVGGTSGSSDSILRKNYAMCTLSGKDYVGGIAGRADKVYDCFSLVNITSADEYIGAIAGDVKTEAKGNRFVNEKIGGIDDISYSGIAQPMPYEDFAAIDGLPDAFRSFEITFVADGVTVKQVPFNYGDDLSDMPIPDVPSKAGYYGRWDNTDFSELCFSKWVEAVYTQFVTTLASVKQRGNKSIMLVEGNFGNEAILSLYETEIGDIGKLPCDKSSVIDGFAFELKNDDDSDETVHTYRVLAPEKHKNVRLFVKVEDKWVNVPYTVDGSYLVFSAETGNSVLLIAKAKTNWLVTVIVVLIILAAAFAVFVVRTKKGKSLVARLKTERLKRQAAKKLSRTDGKKKI